MIPDVKGPAAGGSAVPDAVRRLLDAELAHPSRLGYVLLMLAGTAMTALTVSLLITEPVLPLRTAAAFGVMAMMGLGWTGFAAWVLARRRVLYGQQRVVAGRMALTFSLVFLLGTVLAGLGQGSRAALFAAGMGVGMGLVAWMWLQRAKREVARLVARRQVLERERAGRFSTGG